MVGGVCIVTISIMHAMRCGASLSFSFRVRGPCRAVQTYRETQYVRANEYNTSWHRTAARINSSTFTTFSTLGLELAIQVVITFTTFVKTKPN